MLSPDMSQAIFLLFTPGTTVSAETPVSFLTSRPEISNTSTSASPAAEVKWKLTAVLAGLG